ADLIIWMGNKEPRIWQQLKQLTEAPIVKAEVEIKKIYSIDGEELEIKDKAVGLFCGVGNPQRVEETVKKRGAQIVATHFLPDHRAISSEKLLQFAALCKGKGADYLICTEKDRVKLPKVEKIALPIGWLEVRLAIVENEREWEMMLKKIIALSRS
ncbi:MAG TPA: tetraacyldisaccharide 4'-kinase, partial [Myxococcota bacterium]|nr:tetraacyldisaccharide 4'-kinase [Myxococcota bacterium]